MRSKSKLLLVCAVALVLSACNKTWIITFDGTGGAEGGAEVIYDTVLTPDNGDEYVFESTGAEMNVAALDTNTGGNLRAAFWPAAAPAIKDSQSCATWTSQTEHGSTQQGAALRLTTDAAGTTRALTVTKNIYMGGIWFFNFHTWDTSRSPEYKQLGTVELKDALYGKPYPWKMCARVIGESLEMKVWASIDPEPEWGDTTHGHAIPVAKEWVYPGAAGWYIGHVPTGGFAEFDDLKTWKYDLTPATTTTVDGTTTTTVDGTTTNSVDGRYGGQKSRTETVDISASRVRISPTGR